MKFRDWADACGSSYSFGESFDSYSVINRGGYEHPVLKTDVVAVLTQLLERNEDIANYIRRHPSHREGSDPWVWNEGVFREVFRQFFQGPEFARVRTLAGSQTRPLLHLLTTYVSWKLATRINPEDGAFPFSAEELRAALNASASLSTKEDSESLRESFKKACALAKEYNNFDGPWSTNDPKAKELQSELTSIQQWVLRSLEIPTHYLSKVSRGAGKFPKSPWIAFLPPGQTVNNGRYVAVCFGREGAGAVVGYAQSVSIDTGLEVVRRSRSEIRVRTVDYDDAFHNPKEFFADDFDAEAFKEHLQESMHLSVGGDAQLRIATDTKEEAPASETLASIALQCHDAVAASGLQFDSAQVATLLAAMLAKPFTILTGATGTGKTRLAESVARWLSGGDLERVRTVSVGSDWTDNRAVVGFVNHLRAWKDENDHSWPVFQSTPILDHILAAASQPHVPYILILDEMNLSHVERYFADMLSAMESIDRVVHVHSEPTSLSRTTENSPDVPPFLRLPENLFVVGTVNVDETTHMFSPKVLDRAFVIEFQAPADAVVRMFASRGEAQPMLPASEEIAAAFLRMSRSLRDGNEYGQRSLEELVGAEGSEANQTALQDAYTLMLRARRPFAYRTIREFQRYLAARHMIASPQEPVRSLQAFDEALLLKVLPRVHGSRRSVAGLLGALAIFCRECSLESSLPLLSEDKSPEEILESLISGSASASLPRSLEKVVAMLDELSREQYVNFLG